MTVSWILLGRESAGQLDLQLESLQSWSGKTAARAPRKGPTMKTQKVPGQVPETIAGPKERAGLMEQPSMGNRTA